jgi:hypothetical protein
MSTTAKTSENGLKVRSSIDVGSGADDMGGLAALAKKDGSKFVVITGELTRSGKLRWEQVDMRGLFAALIDVPCTVRAFIPGIGERTMTTSAFPILAGQLTAELLERPDPEIATIWQELVTLRDTNKETTHLVRIVNSDPSHVGGKRRVEGDPYPLMVSGEERVQVDTVDDGRRLAIGAKVIETNDKAGFLDQVNSLKSWAMNRRDVVTLHRVYDLYGSGASPSQPYVYRPNGSGTALYTTSATAHRRAKSGTRVNNNAIVDGASLQALVDVLANMRDELDLRVSALTELELLGPHALGSTLDKILTSEMTPGVENEVNPFGPKGRYKIKLILSPKVDDFTTTSVILARSFKKQFRLVVRVGMEYVSMPASMQDFLRNRLAFEARIADEFEVGAQDHNRAVQSLAGTAAPTGPTLGS